MRAIVGISAVLATLGAMLFAVLMTLLSAVVNNLVVIGLIALGALFVVAYRQSREPKAVTPSQDASVLTVWDVAASQYRQVRPVLLADGSTTWVPVSPSGQQAIVPAVTRYAQR